VTDNAYPKLAGGAPDLPALELEVLEHWASDDTFQASIARRADAPEYVFYDGPPFANGLPHYGHLLTGYVKDIVPRYRTMRWASPRSTKPAANRCCATPTNGRPT
jgi:isoleucyl-tRNA synthetase